MSIVDLHSDIKVSILIPRETEVMLTDSNGCICSRLFTEIGESIVKVRKGIKCVADILIYLNCLFSAIVCHS